MTALFSPPESLTWYHLRPLLAAEAGTLTYNSQRYPIHAVSNNAMACYWSGLLTDGEDGMVLTDLGRRMLADWHASPEGQQWAAEWAAEEERAAREAAEDATDRAPASPTRPPSSDHSDQLHLFTGGVA